MGMGKLYILEVSKKVNLLMFFNKNIFPKHLLSFILLPDIQAIPVEVKLKQRKLLDLSIYKPQQGNLNFFLNSTMSLTRSHILTKKLRKEILNKTRFKNRDNKTRRIRNIK